jgi:hypothetical protein
MVYYCIKRGDAVDPYYNQNYSRDQIGAVLAKIKSCITSNHYTVALNENRKENTDFVNEYNIRSDKLKSILLQLLIEDFCHTLRNTKIGFEHEILYVFAPQVKLYNPDDEEEIVDVYIKFNLLDLQSGSRVVVISFHKRNKVTNYLFR